MKYFFVGYSYNKLCSVTCDLTAIDYSRHTHIKYEMNHLHTKQIFLCVKRMNFRQVTEHNSYMPLHFNASIDLYCKIDTNDKI